jgi:hypothetical protein
MDLFCTDLDFSRNLKDFEKNGKHEEEKKKKNLKNCRKRGDENEKTNAKIRKKTKRREYAISIIYAFPQVFRKSFIDTFTDKV